MGTGYFMKVFSLCLFLISLLSGCSEHHKQENVQPAESSAQEILPTISEVKEKAPTKTSQLINNAGSENHLLRCQQSLDSLIKINSGRGNQFKQRFNTLLSSASEYATIRNQTDNNIRLTVDSLYEFRTNKLCADINKSLLDNLILRGEKQ